MAVFAARQIILQESALPTTEPRFPAQPPELRTKVVADATRNQCTLQATADATARCLPQFIVEPNANTAAPSAGASLVLRRRPRPPQPASRFVTIGRNVPLSEAGWSTTNHNFAFSAIDLFLYPGLESPEDIGAVLKFRFFAQRIVSTEAASETN